jgi:sugar phosphate permease
MSSAQKTPTALSVPGRYEALALFSVLAAITYLDRLCMSMAAVPIRAELRFHEVQMGLVFGAFTLAYLLFEIPSGWLGDWIGPPKVLLRIVLWWSVFTALTGWASSLWLMIGIRFAFGAGEAGAFPSIARELARWFPSEQRGRAQGVLWMSARLGGALAAPITGILIRRVGWRWAFPILGCLGPIWAIIFYLRYRRVPPIQKVAAAETSAAIPPPEADWPVPATSPREGVPWAKILTNVSVWGLAGATFWSAFSWFFYATWLPTYLKDVKHLTLDQTSWLASLPLFAGVAGCGLGGWVSDALANALGSGRWARRMVGFAGAMMSGVCFLFALWVRDPLTAVLLMAASAFWNDVTLSCLWAANMDIGERFSGIVSGVVNTASGTGALISPLIFGYLVRHGWPWSRVLLIAAGGYMVGGLFWLLVDPTRTVSKTAYEGDRRALE